MRATPPAGGEPPITELDPGPLGDLTRVRDPVRVDQPAQRLERTQRDEQLVVAEPGRRVEVEHSGQRRTVLLEQVTGAGHASIMAAPTDIRAHEKP